MNADRRARILKLAAQLSDIKSQIETLAEEEREAFENLPENLQASDKGQASETAATWLEDAASALDDTDSSLAAATE